MGTSRWSADDWKGYSAKTTTKTADEIFTSRKINPDLDPKGVKIRESRDSLLNPTSNAIILGLDVTGSMGMLADRMAKEGLGVLVGEILKRKPVSDPHIMVMGIGDAYYDTAPLQASQFEADLTIAKQLEKIYLEHGGGGNSFESYHLPWYFAAMHTSIDCFEKRNKKGYLFTIGDEEAPGDLLASQVKKIIGDDLQEDLTIQQLLAMVGRTYNIFHIIVEEGSHARTHGDQVMKSWNKVLGQRVLRLADHTKLAEVVVSAIEVNEGAEASIVSKTWSKKTALVVQRAVGGLSKRSGSAGGVARLA